MRFFGGVEGGASNTTVVVLDEHGKLLAREDGSGSNGWLLGAGKVADLLIDLFDKAKLKAGVTEQLASMGLCMSGFLQPRIQEELRQAFAQKARTLSRHYYIENDSPGSVFTAAGPAGGLVIICGTGTMAQLIDGDGKAFNCGGWGHMFGDEGSAYHIASTAIRHIFYGLDGYTPDASRPVPDVSVASGLMMQYFGIADRDGMLDVFYKDFSKGRVAGFTRLLADAARSGDAFCASAFTEAGRHLGSMARTLAPRLQQQSATPTAAASSGDVHDLAVVCVGSVWKSFDLLQGGFVAEATAPFTSPGKACVYPPGAAAAAAGSIQSFKLLRLTESSAVGAAWKGAREVGVSIPLDFSKHTEVLFSWP